MRRVGGEGVHFGDRARGAKIGPSEEGGVSESGCRKREQRSALEAPGRLARWSLKKG
jgi:hypothetical protein